MAQEKLKPYRSRAYERFYKGFSEQEVTDENGRIRVMRIYTGNYYARKCSDTELRVHRICCLLRYLSAVCLYLFCAAQRIVYNSLPLTTLLEGAALVTLLFFLFPLYYHLQGRRRMIERVYLDASKRYRQCSLAAAVAMFATAVSIPVQLALYRVEIGGGLLLTAGFGLCGGIMLWLYLEERHAEYEIFSADKEKE